MPFQSKRPALELNPNIREQLEKISSSRTESHSKVERAKMIISFADGASVSQIARSLSTNRPKVDRCIDKALRIGPLSALDDFKRSGRPQSITPEAKAWLVSLACKKPLELGYSYELWTTALLAKHCRRCCKRNSHPSLLNISKGTVSKVLSSADVKPHKIKYYLERRDPEFDKKMAEVLCVYKEVELLQESGGDNMTAILSYDEKPGIQAISSTTPDLPIVPGDHAEISRDYEYVRHGTVTLMGAIDLISGHIHGSIVERHRSREFVDFLKGLDEYYDRNTTIKIILDNHSAHVSKETMTYLSSVPNRFDFVFTPKHGSWLNLIESFFAKMTKSFLRGIRVNSKKTLVRRIRKYLDEINQMPVIFRWKYKMDEIVPN